MTREELLKIAKPVLFNTEMVKAILEGRKTVTRRIVKFLDGKNPNWTGYIKDGLTLYNGTNEPCNKKPPFKKGDYLYVRETWCWCPCWDCGMDSEEGCCDKTAERFYHSERHEYGCYGYRASFVANEEPFERWYPSIHMPKEAARIFLKVMNVRVERLQDIIVEPDFQKTVSNICAEGLKLKGILENYSVLVDDFKNLWNSTIKKADLDKYGWDVNPWVWVIEFERVEV